MKILIADDDATCRLLLGATLQTLGYEVVSTAHGQEAWEWLQGEHFPLLISDWMMPELDGPELCRKVRAQNAEKYTYVVLLTLLEGKSNYLEGMRAGADDFITKPFDEDQLVARLQVAQRILGLQTRVRQLEGLLPICCYCKNIRDEKDHWVKVESYLQRRTEVSFTHGICPRCLRDQVQPELMKLGIPASRIDLNGV